MLNNRIRPLTQKIAESRSCGSPRKRNKILFVGEAVSLAHVGRPALLARWAREDGYEVNLACGPEFADAARGEGLDPLPLETIALRDLYARLEKGQFFYTPEILDRYVAAERTLIRDLKPDLVVGDFRLSLNVSARLEGVPMLSTINAHWSPAHPCPLPPPRFGIFKKLPLPLREAVFAALRPLAFPYFARPLDDLRIRHGLAPLRDFRKLYTAGDACAYLDAPDLMPLRQLPAGHFYLGPLAWTPAGLPSPSLESFDARRPLAYVTMGSSGDEESIPKILRVLADCDCNVVLAGIEEDRVENWLKNIPELKGRVISRKIMDPNQTLEHADLTICHSGSGTVYQSLMKGVPVLCMPHNPDQGLIAAAVEQSGAGLNLHPERAHPERLAHTIRFHFLQHSKLKDTARSQSQSLRAYDTRERWLRWLNAYLEVPAHTGPKTKGSKPDQAPDNFDSKGSESDLSDLRNAIPITLERI